MRHVQVVGPDLSLNSMQMLLYKRRKKEITLDMQNNKTTKSDGIMA